MVVFFSFLILLSFSHLEDLRTEFRDVFQALDINRDGKLCAKEMANGLLTQNEVPKFRPVICVFRETIPSLVDCLASFGRKKRKKQSIQHEYPEGNLTEILRAHKKFVQLRKQNETLFNQEMKNENEKNCQPNGYNPEGLPILLTSDWHVEPWYTNDGLPSEYDDRVSRYSGTTMKNMFQCHSVKSNSTEVNCLMRGDKDPPLPLLMSSLISYNGLVQDSDNAPGLLFFLGDIQSHIYTSNVTGDNWNHANGISNLDTQIMQEIKQIFPQETDVFWGIGNNDAAHNLAFVDSTDPEVINCTDAYASAVLNAKFVDNNLKLKFDDNELSQTQFYSQTGFWIKQIDPYDKYGIMAENLFVIHLNTNLGKSNDRQMGALHHALKFVHKKDNGKVFLFGHHPDIIKDDFQDIIGKKYRDLIISSFAGHVHFSSETDEDYFTQLSTISQAGGRQSIRFGETSYFYTSISSDLLSICLTYEDNYFSYDNNSTLGQPASVEEWKQGKSGDRGL